MTPNKSSGPDLGKPFISLKLMELGRSNLSAEKEQKVRPHAEMFSLRMAGRTMPSKLKFFHISGIVRNEWR